MEKEREGEKGLDVNISLLRIVDVFICSEYGRVLDRLINRSGLFSLMRWDRTQDLGLYTILICSFTRRGNE